MFASGSQKRHWMFTGVSEIDLLRKEANERFINIFGENMDENSRQENFLSPAEEKLLMRHFEFILREFCKKFNPTMPKYVQGTALTYFKRFYIHNSIMDYHPRDLMLTCVYLSCKVEEFNVSIGQFVGNLKGDREKFANIILGFELLLMDKLHYHLTVHNPFRPLEGFLIDLKTRYFKDKPESVERLRKNAEEFVERSLSTDVCLIYSPSQIALAGVIYSAGEEGISLDNYVTTVLLRNSPTEEIRKMAQQIKRIKSLVKNQDPLQRELIGPVQRKLENCRNQANNPESEVYKRRLEEMFEEEEEERSRKRAKIAHEEKEAERMLLGV
ncbi:cyclin-H-like [Mercenaria mercenaria]|uniref:cyclin-H-like n=1 Tax=Mercenaria mercenaria TaxID=6596 RepID=UPI001E1D361A|nr:cyclin-H-like [Mercenaria mercenaria]